MKQKIKHLKDIFFLAILFSLTLSSCRQDEISQTELEKTKSTSTFKAFEPNNNNNNSARALQQHQMRTRLENYILHIT